jgi:hypothetical protein
LSGSFILVSGADDFSVSFSDEPNAKRRTRTAFVDSHAYKVE